MYVLLLLNILHLPTIPMYNLREFCLVFTVIRVLQHVAVVTIMVNVLVFWNEMHVMDANVNLQSRIPNPVEV